MALVLEDPHLPNEKRSEEGFRDGARLLGREKVGIKVWRYPGDLRRVRYLAERLIEGPEAVTVALITNAYHFLALFSIFARMGVRVPEDISLVSRNDEHFFRFLDPEPARYTCLPQTRAKAVLSALMRTIQGEHLPKRHFLLVPDFIAGATVAGSSVVRR